MVHLVLVLEHPRVDALVGFRTSKESPSHVPLSSSFCYLSRLVVIYPSHLCHSLSCFFCSQHPDPAHSSQHPDPRQPAQHSEPRHPSSPSLAHTGTSSHEAGSCRVSASSYRAQLAPVAGSRGYCQHIRGPARASGQGYSGRRQAIREGGRPPGKETGHWERRPGSFGRRQTIQKGGQGTHTEKKTRRKEGKEGREEKKRQEKRREGKEKGERKSKRAESDTCISHSHETTTRGDHNGGGLGSEALSRGMQRERRSIVT